jgi:sec-independent protein translocase protein TatC
MASIVNRSRQSPIMTDIVDRARTAVTERAELPGMSLLEHLEELRRRIIHSGIYLIVAFFVAYGFRERIFSFMEKPIVTALQAHKLDPHLVYLNPVDPFNFFIKISLMGGAILASPFILYQVWLFISPGLYRHEKRYILPFMSATVGLFLAGAYFGYHYVYPGALNFLIGYGAQFRPMVTLGEYTELFITVILGLGITFELPILVFFLALFGIVSAGFLWRNIRYAILIIFIIAGIITPTPEVLTMCVFAAPMLVLYLVSIGVAYMVHPTRRDRIKQQRQAS